MEQNTYNIKFIKYSGIIYTLGILATLIYLVSENSYTSGGGNNGGSALGMFIYGVTFLIATVVLIILNYFLSKPKPEDKYLIFLPVFILVIFSALASLGITAYGFSRFFLFSDDQIPYFGIKLTISIFIIIAEIFLMKYIYSETKWQRTKKLLFLLPILLFAAQYVLMFFMRLML